MDKLYAPGTIKKIKNKHHFQLSKSLGQNFLTDGAIVDQIIASADAGSADLVIEIGPGVGVLTAAAAQTAGKVIAVEIDKNLIPKRYQNFPTLKSSIGIFSKQTCRRSCRKMRKSTDSAAPA